MINFTYSIPSTVIFGEGCSAKISDIALQIGAKSIFCIFDKGVKAAGIVDSIIANLKENGLFVTEFDKIMPNPEDILIEEGADLARSSGADAIVAIGGGSALDSAKAINILLTNPSPIHQYEGINLVKNATKPMIAVPTTAGTGSEVTSFSVITDTKRTVKMVIGGQYVGATYALADPILTVGMPPDITAATGMDALTHAIEAYVCKEAVPPTETYALKAVELIYHNLIEAMRNGSNIEARSNMLLGSILAGIAFNSSGLGLVHAIAHPLSAHCHLPHGVANAVVLPYVVEYNAVKVPDKIRDIGISMGLNIKELSAEEASEAVVDTLKELCDNAGMLNLRQRGVSRYMFPDLILCVFYENTILSNPRIPNAQDIINILEKAY